MTHQYPKQTSRVTVIRRSTGEVEEHEIDAGPGITRYLNEEAAETGFLILKMGVRCVSIPVDDIDRWEIELIAQDGWVPENENGSEESK